MTTLTQESLQHDIAEAQAGNPRPFIENVLTITSKGNAVVPFRFNRLQDHVYQRLTGRDYVLKFRQGGSSVMHLARAFTWANVVPFFNAAIITLSTDNGKSKQRLFAHVKGFQERLPPELRQETVEETKDTLVFNNGSRIYVGGIGTKDFGRGETIHFLMASEIGFYTQEEAKTVLTSAVESVVPGGDIIFETTPKLIGSHAHGLYVDAKAGRRPYNAIFVPWWWAEDYALPPGHMDALPQDRSAIALTETERELARQFLHDGIPVEDRIRWRRMKLADRGIDFYSEYPEDEVSCWAAATQSVFPADRIRAMMMDAKSVSPVSSDGGLWLYKRAHATNTYSMGIDIASGIPNEDYSAAVVICNETGEVAAVLHGWFGPEEFARMAGALGKSYHNALIGGERDAWTLQTMQWLERLGYPSLYSHENDDGKLVHVGFPNTHVSRLQGVAALREAIKQNDFRTYHEPLILELSQYQKVRSERSTLDQYGAPDGLHDDLCVAAQRAQQIRLTAPASSRFFSESRSDVMVSEYPAMTKGW